jgi:hypothetical protein
MMNGGAEWVAVPAFAKVLQIVSRASNRVFVGAPICESVHLFDFVGC